MSYIEKRIGKLLDEATKLEVRVAYHQIEWGQWESSDDKSEPPEYLLNDDEELTKPFRHLAKSLYLSVVYYLDCQKLDNYSFIFYEIFGKDPDKPSHVDSFDVDHYWSGELYSVFLSKLRQFLSVFEFLETVKGRYERLLGIQYLETVLKNTASIISKIKKEINSEAEVYGAVRNTLEAIFPSSKSPKSNFIKTAKEYKPDILIPEIFAAVEYKYAKDEAKLKATIEQIAADVKGYTGDRDYSIFYAVFYVTEDFWGTEKFSQVWKEQKFPQNWIPIYVVGK